MGRPFGTPWCRWEDGVYNLCLIHSVLKCGPGSACLGWGLVANFCESSSEFSGSVKLGDLSVSCITTNLKFLLPLLQIRLWDMFRFIINLSN